MSRKQWLMTFGAGVLVGLIVAFFWPATAPVAAQGGKADAPRFQISSWSFPGWINNGNQGGNAASGAYVIDTQNGGVWLVTNDQKPKKLGKAE